MNLKISRFVLSALYLSTGNSMEMEIKTLDSATQNWEHFTNEALVTPLNSLFGDAPSFKVSPPLESPPSLWDSFYIPFLKQPLEKKTQDTSLTKDQRISLSLNSSTIGTRQDQVSVWKVLVSVLGENPFPQWNLLLTKNKEDRKENLKYLRGSLKEISELEQGYNELMENRQDNEKYLLRFKDSFQQKIISLFGLTQRLLSIDQKILSKPWEEACRLDQESVNEAAELTQELKDLSPHRLLLARKVSFFFLYWNPIKKAIQAAQLESEKEMSL